ncbi:hypothetical protein LTR27_012029 [Elasticomyces elasticus]|nr:hypothetical protein LTR27_012029 [Elasticomyces elasticus]
MHHSLLLTLCGIASALSVPRQASNSTKYAVKTPPLTTPWTYTAGTDPWPEYPRPQLQRSRWQSLNGIWTYQNASSLDAVNSLPSGQLANEVLIPSCLESGLSGIQGEYTIYSWFATSFSVPSTWTGDRVLLNFAAVDYEATVFVNGRNATFHRGGYFAFTVDVTEYLNADGSNDFGIWQSVWIESAPASHVTQLDIAAGMDGQVNATVSSSGNSSAQVQITVIDRKTNTTVATHNGASNVECTFSVQDVSLWSPDSPTLYDITVTLGDDVVTSYTGFRTIARGEVDGIERPLLNGEFVFQFGTLDQGFWPDGIYLPPNKEAMVYDLQTLKKLGFNMLRKHIKVEPALYYQACDEMGILLFQDMPSLRPSQQRTLDNCTVETILPDAAQQDEFARQLELLIVQQRHFPSIITWVVYNEGWGQLVNYYPEFALTDRVKQLDPTRLVDSTSGWYDHGAGDFSDNHHYANPQCGSPFYSIASAPYDPSRIGVQGEFGGIGQNLSIEHLWNVQGAIDTINQTYEIDTTIEAWNYRGHRLLGELLDQVKMYSCSGGIWTQTTDVEGEVNGLLSYDRRVLRPDVGQWQADIQSLYDAAAARNNNSMPAGGG